LRCNFDNWKVWETFLVVSLDLCNYSDVIRAYHKLLDLKEKYLNGEVLKELVRKIHKEQLHPDEDPVSNDMLKRTRELLGRVTAIYPTYGVLWELYAMVAPVPLLKIQRLQRAYRAFTQGNWFNDLNTCKHVINMCIRMGVAALEGSISPKDTIFSSVRLNITSAISVVKKFDNPDLADLLQDVSTILAKIVIKARKGLT